MHPLSLSLCNTTEALCGPRPTYGRTCRGDNAPRVADSRVRVVSDPFGDRDPGDKFPKRQGPAPLASTPFLAESEDPSSTAFVVSSTSQAQSGPLRPHVCRLSCTRQLLVSVSSLSANE